jgi:hypothetical protein
VSTAKQKADLEAAAVEHELTDAETEALRETVATGATVQEALTLVLAARDIAAGDAGPDDAADAAPSAEPTPKQLRALDTEVTRHLDEVHSIMGHHVEGFVPCEYCGSVGLTPPTAPRPHDNFRPCATCNGHGEVLTGSKREGYQSRQCPDCRGRGYLEKMVGGQPVSPDGPPVANEPTGAPLVPPVPVLAGGDNGAGGEQSYGVPSWMGDPNLGQ